MKQFLNYFQLVLISLFLCSFSACMKENDAEYAAEQAKVNQDNEAQPQLIAAKDNPNQNNEVADVTLPSAKETRNVEEGNNPTEVKFTPSKGQLTSEKQNEKNVATTTAAKSTATAATAKNANAITEIPLKPTTKDVEKAKALPIEKVVTPKIVRGGTVSPTPTPTSQTRSLPSPDKPSSNAMPTAKGANPVMDHEEYDFGNVPEGTKVVHVFHLKNTGSEDLYIQDVDAGCNCTTTDYTFEPIAPGSSTPIKVTFDSNTKVGTQLKNVVISTNNGTKKVKLRGTVFPKDRNY